LPHRQLLTQSAPYRQERPTTFACLQLMEQVRVHTDIRGQSYIRQALLLEIQITQSFMTSVVGLAEVTPHQYELQPISLE